MFGEGTKRTLQKGGNKKNIRVENGGLWITRCVFMILHKDCVKETLSSIKDSQNYNKISVVLFLVSNV